MKDKDKKEVIEKLPAICNLSADFLESRMKKDKHFVWLKRKISAQEVEKINALKIKGLDFRKESKRYHPNQFLAAHLIGFAGMDNQGLEGLELKFNRYLKGEFGWSQIIRDAKGRKLLFEKIHPQKDGFNLVLTIDETIQFIAERYLDKSFKKHRAKGASIIIMDPKTGEILALANRPTFDLHNFEQSPTDSYRNRAISDFYEPGSVFKIVTASAALEEGVMKESDTFFCENGKYRVGNHILHDHQPHGTLTFSEVFEKSSNIGVTKVAQKLGADTIYKYEKLFKFGMPTGIDLLGEVAGIVKPPSKWSKTSIGAVPIGHEVATTAIQLLCAISAIANDGVYMRPFVVKYIEDQKGEFIQEFQPIVVGRVISKETADRVEAILEKVVEKGTGKRACISNTRVAGKTGTAQKVVDGKYSHNKYFASFIGFAPVDDPKIAIVVVFDEPYPNYFGGTVAAPVFRDVARDVLKYLELQKSE